MRILISGGGTAGLSLAYWLKRSGFIPTIVESAPALRTGGYKVDVRGEALTVLHRAGIYNAVVAANTDMQAAYLVDNNGKVLHQMSGDQFGHRVGDDQEIMRGTLNKILLDRISDVEIIYDDAIKSIIQTPQSVQVEFKKSFSRSFDLLIGADGLHSNVRKLVFGDETNFLGIRAAKLFNSQNQNKLLGWLINKLMAILPGYVIKYFIHGATKRINEAANSIVLKSYW